MKKAIYLFSIIFLSSQFSFSQTTELVNSTTHPSYLTEWNGNVYFLGYSESNQPEIWKTDGTSVGTLPLSVTFPIDLSTDDVRHLGDYNIGNSLLFVFRKNNKDYIWKLDENENLSISFEPDTLMNWRMANEDKFYFGAGDDEIWVSDGTTSGTQLLFKKSNHRISEFNVLNEKLHFLADTTLGISWPKSNRKLYQTDGTLSGTQHVITFDIGTYVTSTNVELFAGEGKVGGIYATDPFYNTTYIDAVGFPQVENRVEYHGGSFIYDGFFKDDDLFYFATELTRRDSTGRPLLDPYLYQYEKGASSPNKIKTIIGNDIMGKLPDGRFLFTGYSNIVLRGTPEKTFLGVTDGTEDGTFFLKDFSSIDSYLRPAAGRFNPYGDGYIFYAERNGVNSFWYTDGTKGGTRKITDFHSTLSAFGSISNYTILGQTLLFVGSDGLSGSRLWKIDLPESFNIGDLVLESEQFETLLEKGDTAATIFRLYNEGDTDFSNIEIDIELGSFGQLLEGNEFSTTQGNLIDFDSNNPTWQIGNLSPDSIAELTLNLKALEFEKFSVYGQVSQAFGLDSSSTPDNGTCCQPVEDDESVVVFNPRLDIFKRPDYDINIPYFQKQVIPGDSLPFSYEVTNSGNLPSDSLVKVSFYGSLDYTPSSDDIFFGTDIISNIPRGGWDGYSKKVHIPDTVQLGAYRLIADIDSDNSYTEVYESNNRAWGTGTFQIYESKFDLTPSFFSTRETLTIGRWNTLYVQMDNLGQDTSLTRTEISLYISVDPSFEIDGDHFLGEVSFPEIAPGESIVDDISFLLESLPIGSYYYVLVADHRDEFSETNENNNVFIWEKTKLISTDENFPFVDLRLSYEIENIVIDVPDQGESFTTKLILRNVGTEAATNTEVNIPEIAEALDISNENYQATHGAFNWNSDRLWLIDTLDSGESASLEITYERTDIESFTICAEVWDCDQPSPEVLYADGACSPTLDASQVKIRAFQTSGIDEISDNKDDFYLKNIFPNPFDDALTLEIHSNKNETVNIQFYDAIGRSIYTDYQFLRVGTNKFEIDGTDFSNGLIFIKVGNQVSKVIKG